MTNKDVQEAANTIIRYCREYSKENSACVDCVVNDFCNGVAARKAPGVKRIVTVSDDINTMLLEVLQAVNDWK